MQFREREQTKQERRDILERRASVGRTLLLKFGSVEAIPNALYWKYESSESEQRREEQKQQRRRGGNRGRAPPAKKDKKKKVDDGNWVMDAEQIWV